MKTQEQILRYVSHCEFSADDWKLVLKYCREEFDKGKAHKARLPLFKTTWQEFLDWIETGLGTGDVIAFGTTLGVVKHSISDTITLAGYLSYEKEFVVNEMDVFASKTRLATPEEKDSFWKTVVRSGYRFSVPLASFSKMYQPEKGDIVHIYAEGTNTVGVYHKTKDDEIQLYVYVQKNKIVTDHVISALEAVLSLPTKADTTRLQKVLVANKLEWSARARKLKTVKDRRAMKNERYWYLTDRFTVCSDIDAYTKLHDERFGKRNYFNSYTEALLFLQKLLELRENIRETQ